MQTIKQALANVGVPVERPDYKGNLAQYITYQILGQVGAIYAEGKEAASGVSYTVDIWSKTSFIALLEAVKAALSESKYIAVVEMEYYDDKSGYYHVNLTASTARTFYG